MNDLFSASTPENLGISSSHLKNFLETLYSHDLPLHSAIVMRHDQICMEAYYTPYTRETLHRMFSITKSFVSIAIGLLEEEGRLSLDDHIVDFFPEKLPNEGAYPYMQMMTIRDMLAMTTCHDKTTYKGCGHNDWVGSFFTTTPTHVPGTNFAYDTSSTHTLGALVEKLTGMELIDYLRIKFLDEIGFSKEAYILKDPYGISMGGSGMCATPYDLLKVLYLIANNGKWGDHQLLPAKYIQTAKVKHSDPYGKQTILEDVQGYGYQIWMTRHNGFVMFGMGGQLALYVPDKDLYLITTADVQGRQGGSQLIFDAFWQEVYNKISDQPLPEDPVAFSELKQYTEQLKLFVMPGSLTSKISSKINGSSYSFDSNACKWVSLKITLKDDTQEGSLIYENATGEHTLSFGLGKNVFGLFPEYNLNYAASAAWRTENDLLIKIQIIDSVIGNLYIGLSFKDPYITVMLRKFEENLFTEYNGIFSGKKK